MVIYDWIGFKHNKNVIYFFQLLFLILVAGLRYKVGGDTFYYMDQWEKYPTIQNMTFRFLQESEYNILWDLTISVCKSIFDNFIFFQFIHTIFVNLVFFWFFKKYTPYIFTAVFWYAIGHFLYFNTEILREILCICLFMLSTPALLKKHYIKFYLICLIALGFHNSSVIMLIAPFLLFFKPFNLKSTIIISIIFLVFSSVLFLFAKDIIQYLDDPVVYDKFSHYTDNYYSIKGIIYQFFLCIPVGIIIYLNKNNTDKTSVFHNLLSLLFVLYIISLAFYTITMRMCNYIVPFYIVLGVNIFMKSIKDVEFAKKIQNLLPIKGMILIAVFCIFFDFGYFYFKTPYENIKKPFYIRYYPYTSVFTKNQNKTILQERFNFVHAQFREYDDDNDDTKMEMY